MKHVITLFLCLGIGFSAAAFTLSVSGTPWDTLGQGFDGYCYALAVAPNGDVYAGGYFTEAGGISANYVAKWDGTAWSSLGVGLDGQCEAIAIAPNGDVYVGGNFTQAGGQPANNIAKWDGIAWSALGSGLDLFCNDIEIASNGDVYAGGLFLNAGGVPANNVAVWDGTAWSGLGMGVNSQVSDMALDSNDDLYVGGQFSMAGGSNIMHLAKWDGISWSQVGPTQVNSAVTALIVDEMDNLYIAGIFNVPATGIAKWDGTEWSPLGYGLINDSYGMAFDSEGNLYVVGQTVGAGNFPYSYIAKWNGAFWINMCTDISYWGITVAIDDDNTIYVGGLFQDTDGCPANYIASLDGNINPCFQEEDCLQTLGIYSDLSWKVSTTPEPGWLLPSFDDSGWEQAAYDTDCGQNNNVYSSNALPIWDEARSDEVYFRKTFNITNIEKVFSADVQSRVDDDHILYLNGTIVHQDNDGDPQESLYTQDIKNLLVEGENVFAVYGNDALGNCESFYLRSLILYNDVELIDTLLTTPEICGNANGTITVLALGTDTLTYSIDSINYQTANLFENLPAGDYRVFVKNQEGCLDFVDITIGFVDGPVVDNILPTPAGCTINNGNLTVTASGGTGQIIYSFDGMTFQASNQFTGLSAGIFTVTIQDENGCTASQDANIPPSDPPIIDAINVSNAICGNNNGSLEITASGGTGIIEYSLDNTNFQPGNIFNLLSAGAFTVSVQDDNGCITMQTISVGQDDGPQILDIAIEDATCGNDNGILTINANGGLAPIVYSIDGSLFQSSSIFMGLPAGNYSVVVQDANGCESTSMTSLLQMSGPVIDNFFIENTTCGIDNGEAHVVASGGTGSLQYSIDSQNFQASADFLGLSGGDYTLSVSDANNCIAEILISILTSDGPVINNIDVGHAICNLENGSLSTMVAGGTPPLMYSIDGASFQSSSDFLDLAAASYSITVQDGVGCLTTESAVVQQQGAPSILQLVATDGSCETQGSISIIAEGGTGQLIYSIDGSTFQASLSFENLLAGNYVAIVQDENQCVDSTSTMLNETPIPDIEQITTTGASCNDNDGSITVTASGGFGNLQYSIDGISYQSNPIFTNIQAGSYEISIEDDGGCIVNEVVFISQAASPEINGVTISAAECGLNGSLLIQAMGGNGLLTYSINGESPSIKPEFYDLQPGEYLISVLDTSGCSSSQTVQIPSECDIFIPSVFSPNNDGINDIFRVYTKISVNANVLEFVVLDRWGGIKHEARNFVINSSENWWDGSSKDRDAIAGVYAYFLRVDLGGQEIIKKGEIQLIR